MKTGKTLQELAIELDRQQGAKKDLIVDTGALGMDARDDGISLSVLGGSVNTRYGVGEIAHRQIGQYLKIPAVYYDRMRKEYPQLLALNVNGWFAHGAGEKRMLRTMDGTARALLSDRYRRIDNFEVASAVLPIISGMDGASVESCELTESRMYLKVVNPRVTAEVRKGDIVQAGSFLSPRWPGRSGCMMVMVFGIPPWGGFWLKCRPARQSRRWCLQRPSPAGT